eukprot:GCRY01001846.1.p1 GENE.GCRY01001846.1~~GCRY01001846.1.p1  ORF type:complete len:329 (-),score=40.56 GCRY01001846.1:369-1355(-)
MLALTKTTSRLLFKQFGPTSAPALYNGSYQIIRPITHKYKPLWMKQWLPTEKEELIRTAYHNHNQLGDYTPYTEEREENQPSKDDLESLNELYHYPASTFGDKVAYVMVNKLFVPFLHMFFGKRHTKHAICLETAAAVPGMVASSLRFYKSLRCARLDNGWINSLYEEAENERMHMNSFMSLVRLNLFDRVLIKTMHIGIRTLYTPMYIFFPKTAHRFTGYIEEAAVKSYTTYIDDIDNGHTANPPAPDCAKQYWHLGPEATVRDMLLYIRADECMHRQYNHYLSEMLKSKGKYTNPHYLKDEEYAPHITEEMTDREKERAYHAWSQM